MSTPSPVIDVHAHVLFPQLEALVTEKDPEGLAEHGRVDAIRHGATSQKYSGAMIRERWELLTDLSTRLARMEASGVDVQIVSPSPSHYYAFAQPELARELATMTNRLVREYIDQVPDKFHGLGLVPLQHPDLMVEMLDDAVIGNGLLGVEIGSYAPDGQGGTIELSDKRLDAFWARAQELDAVIFLHPFGCPLEARLDRFYLSNTVAQPAENAVALSHLIFSGVLDRYPHLKVLAAHGGGYLPRAIGRSDRAWKMRPEARDCVEPPSAYLGRLWFDSLVHGAGELVSLASSVGVERIILGSDYPFDMGTEDPASEVAEADLSTAEREAILRTNAVSLGLRPLAAIKENTQQTLKGR